MVFDLHNDFPTAIEKGEFASYVRSNDVKITSVIWTSEFENASARVNELYDALKPLNNPIAIEDIGFLADGRYKEFDFSRYFYCSLTWNYDNSFAGGALGHDDLTSEGRRVIERMNGVCAVDLAHLNRKSFYSVLDNAKKPICSHTGFNEHPRSLDECQIKALVARNTPIGLCAVTKFTDAYTATELANAIDDFVQRYGKDTLCVGTDFYGSSDLPNDFKSYADFFLIEDRLRRLGYSQADIHSIFYGNAMRFYEELQHERHL